MKKFLLGIAVFFAPVLAFAAGTGSITDTFTNLNTTANSATGFIGALTRTVNAAVPLLLAVAIVVFIWSVIRFVLAKGADDRKKAQQLLIWSVISIAVILSIFGLAKFLVSFFGISTGTGGVTKSDIPCVPTGAAGTSC